MRNHLFAGLLCAAMASMGAAQGVTINELWIDQPSTDNDEMFELSGPHDQGLDGYFLIAIGDSPAGKSGVVESVTDLTGKTIPADGYFLCTESTFNTGLYGTPDYVVAGNGLNFENSDNITYLLVKGFTGALSQDLDTDDDGVFDVTPWTSVEDSVAIVIDPTFATSERIYSTTVMGPDGLYAPGHIYRYPNGSGPWQLGLFSNAPATPGTANNPPTSLSGNIDLQLIVASPAGQAVTIEFRTPSTTTVVATYPVTLDASGNYAVASVLTGAYDIAAKGANWLRQVLASQAVSGATVADFSLINGDADVNNAVDLFDINVGLSNFGTPDVADVDWSGLVDLFDLNIFLGSFGTVGDP